MRKHIRKKMPWLFMCLLSWEIFSVQEGSWQSPRVPCAPFPAPSRLPPGLAGATTHLPRPLLPGHLEGDPGCNLPSMWTSVCGSKEVSCEYAVRTPVPF